MKSNVTRDPLIAEVRAGLARKGLTQAQLADHLRISRQAVTQRLAQRVPFSHVEVRAMSQLLDVPVAVLYGEESTP